MLPGSRFRNRLIVEIYSIERRMGFLRPPPFPELNQENRLVGMLKSSPSITDGCHRDSRTLSHWQTGSIVSAGVTLICNISKIIVSQQPTTLVR